MRFLTRFLVSAALAASIALGPACDDAPKHDDEMEASLRPSGSAGSDRSNGDRDSGAAGAESEDSPSRSDAGSVSPDVDREQAAMHFCDVDCGREQDCSGPNADCDAQCMAKIEHWGGAFLDALADCLEAIACAKDDPCYGMALADVHPAYNDHPVVVRCMARSDECGFDADLCPSLLILTESAQADAMSCLFLECSDGLGGCLETAGAFSP